MRVNLEGYLLTNLFANFLGFALSARALGRKNRRREALFALLGCALSLLPREMLTLPVRTAGTLLLPVLAAGAGSLREGALAVCAYMGVNLLLAGAVLLVAQTVTVGQAAILLGLALGGCAGGLFLRVRRERIERFEIEVKLRNLGRARRFTALVDTGNRLHEPVSGFAVLIAEKSLIKPVLPKDGYSEARFGGVGSSGSIRCFHPEDIWVNQGNGWVAVSGVCVGVYPGKLPGSVRALAPASLAILQK